MDRDEIVEIGIVVKIVECRSLTVDLGFGYCPRNMVEKLAWTVEANMGLLDWFRKPKPKLADAAGSRGPSIALSQLCYDVDYFVLPHYAFEDLAQLTDLCLKTPSAAGPFYYIMAAMARKVEPDTEAAKQFHWHHGWFDVNREYFALEYPKPPPIDLSEVDFENVIANREGIVLAPHFSAIIRSADTVIYFVLGQAPMGGGTTLRCVLKEGANCNLGPGPDSNLSAFLEAVEERTAT